MSCMPIGRGIDLEMDTSRENVDSEMYIRPVDVNALILGGRIHDRRRGTLLTSFLLSFSQAAGVDKIQQTGECGGWNGEDGLAVNAGCGPRLYSGLGDVAVVSERRRAATTLTVVVRLFIYRLYTWKPTAFSSLAASLSSETLVCRCRSGMAPNDIME